VLAAGAGLAAVVLGALDGIADAAGDDWSENVKAATRYARRETAEVRARLLPDFDAAVAVALGAGDGDGGAVPSAMSIPNPPIVGSGRSGNGDARFI
jgi:hypothetical protein